MQATHEPTHAQPWHLLATEDALRRADSDAKRGLASDVAAERLEQFGPNRLIESGGRTRWEILVEQFRSALVVLLLVAAAVSFFLGESIDGGAILVIVALNAALGYAQERRAEKALAALKQYDVPTVRVVRDGVPQEISAEQLVPGDVVHVNAGDRAPADARVLNAIELRCQESTLTGESEAVHKHALALEDPDAPLGDRTNMIYKGSLVVSGHAAVLVTATGMQTQLGAIAESLGSVQHEPTPLQKRLGRLGRTLALAALAIVAVVFGAGVAAGESMRVMLMTALSLAVAIVPEGLPAVATVALALGAMRMYRRHALVRRLPAVETLGSVTVICTDKTGTLTENRMAVRVVQVGDRQIELSPDAPAPPQLVLVIAALCNNAEVRPGASGEPEAVGQPTEAALAQMAARYGVTRDRWEDALPQTDEVPFDSIRKRMTTVHRVASRSRLGDDTRAALADAEAVALMKGAADAVIAGCQCEWRDGRLVPLDVARRGELAQQHDQLASQGVRVLGLAFCPLSHSPDASRIAEVERGMALVGLVGLVDPPRAEASAAVARCREAGIRPIMITGDHPLTAASIAQQVGIATDASPVTGRELAKMTDEELDQRVRTASVYARVAPADKLRIVESLQQQREVVAMTGDGVNDAPALKRAHIGVAMGQVGADVSKEASDMVLLDDNFATIVGAVEQGRIVYDNIRKFVQYTMTSNAGEVAVMLAGPLLGTPLPLLPLQILWVNLVTDGLPGLALAVEPAERATMQRRPYPPDRAVIDRRMGLDIVWIGALMAAVSLAAAHWIALSAGRGDAYWRTVVFTVLTFSQMGNVLAVRSARDSLFRIGVLSNKPLLAAVGLTVVMQLLVIYARPLQVVFDTAPLRPVDLLLSIAASTVLFWAIEGKKLVERWLRQRSDGSE